MPDNYYTSKLPKLLTIIPPYGILYKGSYGDIKMEEVILLVADLTDEGFAIYRDDIQHGCIQLTDKGRKLKELGTMEAYRLHEASHRRTIDRLNRRESLSFYIQLALMLWTGIAALYYLLETLRTQYHIGLPGHVPF